MYRNESFPSVNGINRQICVCVKYMLQNVPKFTACMALMLYNWHTKDIGLFLRPNYSSLSYVYPRSVLQIIFYQQGHSLSFNINRNWLPTFWMNSNNERCTCNLFSARLSIHQCCPPAEVLTMIICFCNTDDNEIDAVISNTD